MTDTYSEDKLIEASAMSIFEDLGWKTNNAFHGENFEQGTSSIGRRSERDVVLVETLHHCVTKLNPQLPPEAINDVVSKLTIANASLKMANVNQEFHSYIKNGVQVKFKNSKGEVVEKLAKVIDFEEPENNDYLAVQQLWVEGKSKRRKRPDVVAFINGLPIVFIELKAHYRKVEVAYTTNYTDYRDTIPKIFHHNAFVILSNGIESQVGTITSPFEHFHEWKRIDEEEEGRISLETILKGTCDKTRLLDLFENFIYFDESQGSPIKLLARNHQFIGVNKAIDNFVEVTEAYKSGTIGIEEKQRLGVFWHTQGSGKSYSMVFLCQKIHRKVKGNHTFLLVTDRSELDKQIYATFDGVGALGEDKLVRATSGKDLQSLLKSNHRYVFSLIHKFNFKELISERDDIIVISDEAHRTQGGSLAMNMRTALPNASFIGFTGTPLFKDDELTKRIFGEYVSVYDFKRSIEDGATVPLYYENRGELLELNNPLINNEIKQAIESENLDSDQEEKLKKLFAKDYPIITAEKRLRSVAADVVEHFNTRGYKGKAMYVAIDKITALKMYNFITEAWADYLATWKPKIDLMEDSEKKEAELEAYEWAKETEISVVVSDEQNEIQKFKAYNLDIEPHRLKMNEQDLEQRFKDKEDPFRLAIVCAMWITGFDVPSLSTLYIDKPLRTHTLMQTIARANRTHKGKNNGLIVDYIENYKSLLEALALYAVGGEKGEGGNPPIEPNDNLVDELDEAISETINFLKSECHFSLDKITQQSDPIERLAGIGDGENAVSKNDETKNRFQVLSRLVFKKYKAVMPNKEIHPFTPDKEAIEAIYRRVEKTQESADISDVLSKVQGIVDNAITTFSQALKPTASNGTIIDISGLDFKVIEEQFLKNPRKNTAVQSLKEQVKRKLDAMTKRNPFRIDYYEKYQEIIEEYNQGKDSLEVEETFRQLIELVRALNEEEARAGREGLTEEELTIFDLLRQGKKLNKSEKEEVKACAKELIAKIDENNKAIHHWPVKESGVAKVAVEVSDTLGSFLPPSAYTEDYERDEFDGLITNAVEYAKDRYWQGVA